MQVLYAPHPQVDTSIVYIADCVLTEYINIVNTVALTMSGVEPTCGVGVAMSPSPNLVDHQHEDEPKNKGGPHH